MSASIQDVPSKYAAEGSRAHALAETILSDRTLGALADASEDMLAAVRIYVDFVRSISRGAVLFIEHRFDLSSLHKGLFGTADAVVYQASTKHLIVADYKHGSGIPVEVVGNVQLMYYGLGALLSFGYPCETVDLVVVQPRCPHVGGPIRSWRIDSFRLLDFAADLVEFAKCTEEPDAPLVPGDHCQFCPANFYCPVAAPRPKWKPAPRDPALDFQPVDSSTA